jgi:hypothetical protein
MRSEACAWISRPRKEGQQGIDADIAEIKKLLQPLPRVRQIDTVQAAQNDRDPQPFALFIK